MVAIPIFVWCILSGGMYFFLLILGLILLGSWEALALVAHKGAYGRRVLSLAAATGVALIFHTQAISFILPLCMMLTITTLIVELFVTRESALLNAGATIWPVLYVALPLGSLLLLRQMPLGDQIVFSILGGIWACDSLAYYGGMWLGRHKLFERVSPKKTWEGAVAGMAGAIAGVIVVRKLCSIWIDVPLDWQSTLVIGMVAGTIGQIGDLAESLLKRDAAVKDSSALIPGHGGALDRFDSLIFVAPTVYMYYSLVVR